jgi:heme/copper-type cytochrome/quinol oxidase subunit 1
MLRWFALTVIGFFALYSAWRSHVTHLAPDAPERSGWLFQQLGEQGIVVGTLLMAVVFILIGLVGMSRRARRLRAVSTTEY